MTSFISLYIILGTVCVNLLSAVPEFRVSKPVGSTAVLPCELMRVDTKTLYIKWQIKSKTVFERLVEESYQGEGYEGRVDVPVEELRKGNCSLVLRNLTLTDTGVYTSNLGVTHNRIALSVTKEEISRVHLTVHDQTEERTDKDSSGKTEERSVENSNSSGDTVKVPRYWWWILIVPGLVIPAGFVWWFLKRKKQRQSQSTDTDSPL